MGGNRGSFATEPAREPSLLPGLSKKTGGDTHFLRT